MVDVMVMVGVTLLFLLTLTCRSIWLYTIRYDQEMQAYWQQADTTGTKDRQIAACDLCALKSMLDIKMHKAIMYGALLALLGVWFGAYLIQLGGGWQIVVLILAILAFLGGNKKNRAFHRAVRALRSQSPYLVSTLYQGLSNARSISDILDSCINYGPKTLRPYLQRCSLRIAQGWRVSSAFREEFSRYHIQDYVVIIVFFELYEELGDASIRVLQGHDVFVSKFQKIAADMLRMKKFFSILRVILLLGSISIVYYGLSRFDLGWQDLLLIEQVDWAYKVVFLLLAVIASMFFLISRLVRVEL